MRLRVDVVLGDGLAIINGGMWKRSKARKPTICAMSGRPINVGDSVFRPLGNGGNRMHRVRADRVERSSTPSPIPLESGGD